MYVQARAFMEPSFNASIIPWRFIMDETLPFSHIEIAHYIQRYLSIIYCVPVRVLGHWDAIANGTDNIPPLRGPSLLFS